MAINENEFTVQVDTNLKSNTSSTRFYINFKLNGKKTRKVLDYSNQQWDKRTRVSKAKLTLLELKNKTNNSGTNINEMSILDQLAEIYFANRIVSNWTKELKDVYKIHISPELGKKKIKDIKLLHIDALAAKMRVKGLSKQTKNGCSARTIKKATIECLRPILEYAFDNEIIEKIPKIRTPKKDSKKKIISNATITLELLYNTINTVYKDDPFYRALFLFALYGRRWNEIRTLKWSSIDLDQNLYCISAENNKINKDQIYELPLQIRNAILDINDDQTSLVFKSPITGKELYSPKHQLSKIRTNANMPDLTMHTFRHILTSALASAGTTNTVLSATLGHTDMGTVTKHYATLDHTSSSKTANIIINNILNTKVIPS